MEIIELTDAETHDLAGMLAQAWSKSKTVKVAVQGGGIIVKVGGGVWTPSLGYHVDGNGDPVNPLMENPTYTRG